MISKTVLPCILTLFVLLSCADKKKNTPLEKNTPSVEIPSWLIGTWENKMAEGSLYENWVKLNDTSLQGKTYMIKGADTAVFETVSLLKKSDSLFYIPAAKDQNGGSPVSFSATTVTDKKMVFENPLHDFPQVIIYTRITNDSLVAEIRGKQNGQDRSELFPMKKLNR